MRRIKIKDKEFDLMLSQEQIESAIEKISVQMSRELEEKNPLFICILNGSFMFASELMKRVNIPSEITFIKVSSYEGVNTNGDVKQIMGLVENIKDRTVVVVEDIVDTGYTITSILEQLEEKQPKEIKVATMLLKPKALKVDVDLNYVALEIPSDFIVGYGLDYGGYGRNLPDIYKIIE